MELIDEGSTSSLLLREVSDWQNHAAWVSFRDRYEPLLRRWCRGYGLDDDSIDEVCQRIWIELADRMRTFPWTWDAFWLVAVCDWTVERTAKALEMTHTAVYAARERVARMLRDEGNRMSDCWGADT